MRKKHSRQHLNYVDNLDYLCLDAFTFQFKCTEHRGNATFVPQLLEFDITQLQIEFPRTSFDFCLATVSYCVYALHIQLAL